MSSLGRQFFEKTGMTNAKTDMDVSEKSSPSAWLERGQWNGRRLERQTRGYIKSFDAMAKEFRCILQITWNAREFQG